MIYLFLADAPLNLSDAASILAGWIAGSAGHGVQVFLAIFGVILIVKAFKLVIEPSDREKHHSKLQGQVEDREYREAFAYGLEHFEGDELDDWEDLIDEMDDDRRG